MDPMVAQILLGAGVTTAFHPIAYTKVLIQLGYEPLTPTTTRSIFGRKILCYPSAVKYIGHIRERDGFLGLYRGLGARLIGGVAGSLVTSSVQNYFKKAEKANEDELDGYEETSTAKLTMLCIKTSHETAARCAGLIASQPFHVIMIRTMSEFVGRESIYSNIFCSVQEIYRQDGVLGFFAGLVPRLIGEVATIWLANMLAHVLNTYVIPKGEGSKDLTSYTSVVCALMVTQVTYPFNLVSNVMTINGCGLAAGGPPHTPVYNGWTDCWRNLSKTNALKRGSSLFWRQYKGPVLEQASGVLVPTRTMFS